MSPGVTIDLSDKKPGMYIVNVKDNKGSVSINKVIKN
jgi:hypothetical protein